MSLLLDRDIGRGRKIDPSYEAIGEVTRVIQNGGVIVFPWGRLERRCLALMADSTNVEACQRINAIKTRPANQVLAVNGYPELIADIAKIEDSRPLVAAAERLKIEPAEVIRRMMSTAAISFIFKAREGLPNTVSQAIEGMRTVMIAGELDNTGFDFYTELIMNLHRKDTMTGGTSANRTTSGTYHVFEQDIAYDDLGPDVEIFVYHSYLPRRPILAMNLESCTTFNMIVDSDYPEITRFGSANPHRFKGIVGNYTLAPNVQYLPHHEKPHHMMLKTPFYLLGRVA